MRGYSDLKKILIILIFCIIASLFGVIDIHAASGISDFWVDASSVNAKSYGDDRLSSDMIRWWQHENGKYYIMMPNSANLSKLKVYYEANDVVKVNGKQLVNGAETDIFKNGGEFNLSCGGSTYRLVIQKASKIPSMFISTMTGSLDTIHEDKSNKGSGVMILVGPDGKTEYNGDLEYIKGRGNSTWFNFPKKPYNIKLAESTDLLGMGESKRWCLIANWVDKTHLNNKIAFDLGQEVGIPFTANTRHVDLYINNEYKGLYLLTERNNVGKNQVDITNLEKLTEEANKVSDLSAFRQMGDTGYKKDSYKYYDIPKNPADITGGYLLEFDLFGRYRDEPSGFVTARGQAVVIKSPEYATKEQVEYIRTFFQEMEDAIYSPDGCNSKGKHYTDYVDEESLAKIYILQEFSLNVDAGISSLFFYKESDKIGGGKLHACSPWDLDIAFGVPEGKRDGVDLQNPKVWWANRGVIRLPSGDIPNILNALYKHKGFVQTVTRIWHTEFMPAINKIVDSSSNHSTRFVNHIDVYREEILNSAVMNSIYWNDTPETPDMVKEHISSLSNFIKDRAKFLSDSWVTDIKDLEIVPIAPVVYKGEPVKPKVIIMDKGAVLKEGVEYTISCLNNNSIGYATAKITMKGFYTGSAEVNFSIVGEEKEKLVNAIHNAMSKNKNDFSQDSWDALQSKLATAKTICEKADAAQDEIDIAAKELNDAINALIAVNVDKTNLKNAINSANSKSAASGDVDTVAKYVIISLLVVISGGIIGGVRIYRKKKSMK